MKLSKVKTIAYILIGTICVLLVAMGITGVATFGFIASAVMLATAVFEWKFWRCPYCGKCLGPLYDKAKYCRHCGKEIEK
ncbi:MAG: hypothetical protein RR313_10450 [Anaerovoracaceae bacterium]